MGTIKVILNYLNNNLDKVAHASLSNFISWVFFLIPFALLKAVKKLFFNDLGETQIFITCLVFSTLAAYIIGWYKESKDNVFDPADIRANVIGIFIFILQASIITLLN